MSIDERLIRPSNRSADPDPGGAGSAANPHADARIMMVDDEPTTCEVVQLFLEDAGYRNFLICDDSTRAMDLMRSEPPDIVLLDLMMPAVDGFDILAMARADPALAHTPIVVLTSSSDARDRLRVLELGATDFLGKPVDPSELVLRLRNSLAVKSYQDEIEIERRRADRLLMSMLPESVAARLKRGERMIADEFGEVTVLFSDIVGFTTFAARHSAVTVVRRLNGLFERFDSLVAVAGLEKIKTIGDAYMLAGGVPTERPGHATAVVDVGVAMIECAALAGFEMRVGVHTGSVAAGVIGARRFSYDLWGDAVNVASRMESHGVVGRVHISDVTRAALDDGFLLEDRGVIEIKGCGTMNTWLVLGRSGE